MDKYEYNLKLDEIEKLAAEGEFEEAAEIADSIDWRKVKNVRILCTVSEIYENMKRLEDSKVLLVRAYQRSQIGKSVLYRLIDVSIKLGQFDEAVDYYSQYMKIAPRDVNRYILQYKIFKGRGSSVDDQIRILEQYLDQEYNEKWAYELILLYDKAGYEKKCVEACDELILWFHSGKYVVKALELKQKYTKLSPAQQEAYDNRFGQIIDNMDVENTETEEFDDDNSYSSESEEEETAENGEAKEGTKKTSKYGPDSKEFQQVLSGLRKAVVPETEMSMGVKKAPMFTFDKVEEEEINAVNAAVAGSAFSLSAAVAASQKEAAREITFEKIPYTTEDYEPKSHMEKEEEPEELQTEEPMTEEAQIEETGEEEPYDELAALEEFIDANVIVEEEPENTDPEDYSTELDNYDSKDMRNELANSIHNIISNLGYGDAKEDENSVYLKRPEGAYADQETEEENYEGAAEMSIDAVLTGMAMDAVKNRPEEAEAVEETTEDDGIAFDAEDEEEELEAPAAAEDQESTKQEMEEIYYPDEDELDFDLDDIAIDLDDLDFEEEDEEEDSEEDLEEDEDLEDEEYGESEDEEFEDEDSEDDDSEEEDFEEEEADEEYEYDDEEYEDDEEDEDLEEEFEVEEDSVEEDPDEEEFEDEDLEDDEEYEDDEDFDDEEDEEDEEDDEEEELTEEESNARKASEALRKTLESLEQQVAEANREIEEEKKLKEQKEKKKQRVTTLRPEEKEKFEYYCEIKGMERQIATAIQTLEDRGDAKTSQTGNMIILGRKSSGKTTLGISIVEMANIRREKEGIRVAKIFAADLNHRDIVEVITKIAGGVLIIEEAGDLSEGTAHKLAKIMNARTEGLLIILEDEKKYLSEVMTKYPDLMAKFNVKINIPLLNSDELVDFGHYYAESIDCALSDDGEEALYKLIGEEQTDGRVMTIGMVKEIIDEAKKRAIRFSIGKMARVISRKQYDGESRILLTKKTIREV